MKEIEVGQSLNLNQAQHAMVEGWIVKLEGYEDKHTPKGTCYFSYENGQLFSGISLNHMILHFYRTMWKPDGYIVCGKK